MQYRMRLLIYCYRLWGGENKLIKVGLEVPKRLTTAEYQKMKEEM